MTYYDLLALPPTATKEEIVSRCRYLLVKLGHGRNDEKVLGLTRHLLVIQRVLTEDREQYDAFLRSREEAAARREPVDSGPSIMDSVLGRLKKAAVDWLDGKGGQT